MWSSMLDRRRPRPVLLREADVWTGDGAVPDFAAWCIRHPGARCALWASAAHVHDLVLDVDAPVRTDLQALDWARAQWLQYHGEAAMTWSLAAWSHGGRRGVSALHGLALGGLLTTAREQRVRVTTVRPWWSLALSDALVHLPAMQVGPARLVVIEGTFLTRLELVDGRLEAVHADRLDAPVRRELLRQQADWPIRPTWSVGYGLAGLTGPRAWVGAT